MFDLAPLLAPLVELRDLARRGVEALEGGRAWSEADLLTRGEALARLGAGKANPRACAILDRTERQHAPGDRRWLWADVLEATLAPVVEAPRLVSIPMADLSRQPRAAKQPR